MKVPKPRNTGLTPQRIREWANNFSGYRLPITEDRIRNWIAQFGQDQDLAARLLDCVEFFSHDQIAASFRAVLGGLDGWHREPARRRGRWRFVAYSASAGESGDSMLHKFRNANNLAGRSFNELFIQRSDLLREGLGFEDTVVLVDDFMGTGDQACSSWRDIFGELLAEVGRVYLVVVAAPLRASSRVANETDLCVVPHVDLTEEDNVFSSNCGHFTSTEREALLRHCRRAKSQEPRGKGACGLVVVFPHGCPNNSVPVLHAANQQWEGLFRRYN